MRFSEQGEFVQNLNMFRIGMFGKILKRGSLKASETGSEVSRRGTTCAVRDVGLTT